MGSQRAALLVLGILLLLVGLVFLVGSSVSNTVPRLVVGLVSCLAGGFLISLAVRARASASRDAGTMRVEIGGEIEMMQLECRECGAPISASEGTKIVHGAVFVVCPYCHAEYQLEEQPKW
ncbi:hypothetical protein JW921_08020 [Candidatus Fermentibacterales bacterium]|nr:hypothetical protein [Candidatus Fermentibacterales bacterium]